MTFTLRKLAGLVFLLAICASSHAQESAKPKPSPAPLDEGDVIRINTNVVQVDASVVDKNGKFVTDLRAEDFEITEEGAHKVKMIVKRPGLKVQARGTAYTGRKEAQK